jgi:hypothetical protein
MDVRVEAIDPALVLVSLRASYVFGVRSSVISSQMKALPVLKGFDTMADTRSTRVTFVMGVFRNTVYVFEKGYRSESRLRESTCMYDTCSIYSLHGKSMRLK